MANQSALHQVEIWSGITVGKFSFFLPLKDENLFENRRFLQYMQYHRISLFRGLAARMQAH